MSHASIAEWLRRSHDCWPSQLSVRPRIKRIAYNLDTWSSITKLDRRKAMHQKSAFHIYLLVARYLNDGRCHRRCYRPSASGVATCASQRNDMSHDACFALLLRRRIGRVAMRLNRAENLRDFALKLMQAFDLCPPHILEKYLCRASLSTFQQDYGISAMPACKIRHDARGRLCHWQPAMFTSMTD